MATFVRESLQAWIQAGAGGGGGVSIWEGGRRESTGKASEMGEPPAVWPFTSSSSRHGFKGSNRAFAGSVKTAAWSRALMPSWPPVLMPWYWLLVNWYAWSP